jgi:hypothetical protein
MVAALLNDGPFLILRPSRLTLQWQVELKDRLGIPSAVWLSTKQIGEQAKSRIQRETSMTANLSRQARKHHLGLQEPPPSPKTGWRSRSASLEMPRQPDFLPGA